MDLRFKARRRVANLVGITMISAVFAFANATTAQDDLSSEPYSVYVAKEKVFARCGPSAEYYRTDPLRPGQKLDVYLETDDGWLGVRPLDDSFCWIPESAVEVQSDAKTAVVTEDRTVCWIGTHLGRARQYRWQVQLAEGERLTILGRSERDGPDGPQMWFRIVPPSGEFRWVRKDQVVDSSEKLVAILQSNQRSQPEPVVVKEVPKHKSRTAKDLGNSILETASSIKKRIAGGNAELSEQDSSRRVATTGQQEKLSPLPAGEAPRLAAAPTPAPASTGELIVDQPIGSGLRGDRAIQQAMNETVVTPAAAPVDVTDVATAEFIGKPRLQSIGAGSAPSQPPATAESSWTNGDLRASNLPSPGANVKQATYTQRGTSGTVGPVRYVDAASIRKSEEAVQNADIDQLQLLLSRLMANGASAPEVEPVVFKARELSKQSQDPLLLSRARLLAERSEQYQRVARRRDGSTVIREVGIPTVPTTSGQQPVDTTQTKRGGGVESGYLVQVYSARSDSPPFALTDSQGNTLLYVTPSPGVNLHMHLNNHVKVVGSRGFLRGLKMPHIYVTQASRSLPR